MNFCSHESLIWPTCMENIHISLIGFFLSGELKHQYLALFLLFPHQIQNERSYKEMKMAAPAHLCATWNLPPLPNIIQRSIVRPLYAELHKHGYRNHGLEIIVNTNKCFILSDRIFSWPHFLWWNIVDWWDPWGKKSGQIGTSTPSLSRQSWGLAINQSMKSKF